MSVPSCLDLSTEQGHARVPVHLQDERRWLEESLEHLSQGGRAAPPALASLPRSPSIGSQQTNYPDACRDVPHDAPPAELWDSLDDDSRLAAPAHVQVRALGRDVASKRTRRL